MCVFVRWERQTTPNGAALSGWASVLGWEVSILLIVRPLSQQLPLDSSTMHHSGEQIDCSTLLLVRMVPVCGQSEGVKPWSQRRT